MYTLDARLGCRTGRLYIITISAAATTTTTLDFHSALALGVLGCRWHDG